MVAGLQNHPGLQHLHEFSLGILPESEAALIRQHLRNCERCAERIGLPFEADEAEGSTHWRLKPTVHQHHDGTHGEAGMTLFAHDARFDLLDVLGSGGMGVVYRAWQPDLDRFVAVKQMHGQLPQSDGCLSEAIGRFHREVAALGRASHPHVVQIFSSGMSVDGGLFYVMEFLAGANLQKIHHALTLENDNSDGRPDLSRAAQETCQQNAVDASENTTEQNGLAAISYEHQVVALIKQIANAVQYLHDKGIIHRDIKPANIMVDESGQHATLTDLSLAAMLAESGLKLTRTSVIPGSLPYVSPEQFRGQAAGIAGDIYNLGAVLWEMLALRRLFAVDADSSPIAVMDRILLEEPASIHELRPTVSLQLEAIVLKCLEKEPEARYSTVSELIADLNRWEQDEDVLAPLRHVVARRRRHRIRVKQIAAGVLFLAIPALLAFNFARRQTQAQPAKLPSQITVESSTAGQGTPVFKNARVIDDDSLVAWWSAEGSGLVARDFSSNQNQGLLAGNTIRKPGVLGDAFHFNGKGDHVNLGRSNKWNLLHDGSAFSVTGFLLHTGADEAAGILSTLDEISGASDRWGMAIRLDVKDQLELRIQANEYQRGEFPPVNLKGKRTIPTNTFTPFAVTFDGARAAMYIDGQLDSTQPVTKELKSETSYDGLCLGAIGTSTGPNPSGFDFLEGALDEIQIYNRALTPREVSWLAGRGTRVVGASAGKARR